MLTVRTAGESHGPTLLALVEGLPAGLSLDLAAIDAMLARRQRGPGRSKRQQIEVDRVEVLSGLKGGRTIGSPLALAIRNRDASIETLPNPPAPRPGHADLAGAYKYTSRDLRAVLERASARETAARTAAGAVAALLLREFNIQAIGHVLAIGGDCAAPAEVTQESCSLRDSSPFASLDPTADARWALAIERAGEAGETLGGLFEVVVLGAPPGLGSFAQFDQRLDGRLAAALMSIPAIKGCEIGLGFAAADRLGSQVHDAIEFAPGSPWSGLHRPTNRAGGLEGGVSNGQPIVVRAAMKPIPTQKKGLPSVDLQTGSGVPATYQRSDVCSVPAASVVGEAVVAFEVARAFLEKHGGDTLMDVHQSFLRWRKRAQEIVGGDLESP